MFGLDKSYEKLISNAERASSRQDGATMMNQWGMAISNFPERVQFTCWNYAFKPEKIYYFYRINFGILVADFNPHSLPGQTLCFENEVVRNKTEQAIAREKIIAQLIDASANNSLFGKSDWILKYHQTRIKLYESYAGNDSIPEAEQRNVFIQLPMFKAKVLSLGTNKQFTDEIKSTDSFLFLMNLARAFDLEAEWKVLSSLYQSLQSQPPTIPYSC